jgi:hypothetical protein
MKNKLKLTVEEHAYNEEQMLQHIKTEIRTRGIRPAVKRQTIKLPKFFKLALTTAMVVTFALLGVAQLSNFNPFQPQPKLITVIYALDINPSFEISVNNQDKVVSISATNDDAKTITVEDLIGNDAAAAIETLIKRSIEAGFINIDDLVDDYVLVTSIPMNDEDLDQSTAIAGKINTLTKTSNVLQSLNVAVIKSDLITLRQAEGKKIPIGLYVINGMVKQPDGTYLSAKSFFSNPEYRATFQTKGAIKETKTNAIKEHILIALGKLDAIGVDTTALKNRLIIAEGQDLITIRNEVRKLLNKHKLGSVDESITENI